MDILLAAGIFSPADIKSSKRGALEDIGKVGQRGSCSGPIVVPSVTVKIAAKTGKMFERLSSFDELWLRLYTDTSISDAELDRVQVELNQVGVEWLIQGVRCNWGTHPFNERGHEAYRAKNLK